ncbi:MAG: hypothetical protein Q4A32_00220 [Lachnospiraceae bacterium]|nr:hypothetical protein [Lachnospiraceae bacterium]
MLEWSSDIFLGEGMEDRSGKVIRMLNAGKAPHMTWLITKSSNGVDQLEIMDALYLKQPAVRKRLPEIIGLAISKAEAVKMIHKITEACVDARGDAFLTEFLETSPPVKGMKKISVADYLPRERKA